MVRLLVLILGFAFAGVFAWYESTNSIVEVGRSWRRSFHQLLVSID
jgi:hypothetical protein